jgi:FtsH-binding integral membrane protein
MTTSIYRSASAINSAMVRVYNNMFLAIVASLITSLVVASSPALMAFFFTGIMKWITIFAPLVAILVMSFGIDRLTVGQARLALYGFAVLMGLSFSTIFVVYTIGSIVSAFMGAAVLFGAMSVYGYFTKKDLSGWGNFLFVGLIGIIIVSIINVFVGSSVTNMVVSALAVIIFTGLTAYDTQNIRQMVSFDSENGKGEILGALSLYLNFINIFLSLLQLFGNRDD